MGGLMPRHSHSSGNLDAREGFYREMRRARRKRLLAKVGLALLVLCSLIIMALCAYMYGFLQ